MTGNTLTRKAAGSLIMALLISVSCQGTTTDTLEKLEEKAFVPAIFKIYNTSIRASDSLAAFQMLEKISAIGEKRNIAELPGWIGFFKGKYCYDRRLWKDHQPLRYFQKAREQKELSPVLKAELLYFTGIWYLSSEHNYPLAFEYMIKANTIAEETGYDRFQNGDELLTTLSTAYYQFGEYEKATRYFHLAKVLPESKDNYRIEIYNTLGLVFRDQEMNDSAIFYFQKALAEATRRHNTAWVGITTGNLGSIYYKLKRYQEAMGFLYKDLDLSSRNNQAKSAANAALLIAQIYFEAGKTDSALQMLQRGRMLASICNDTKVYILLYKNLARYYKDRGDDRKALYYIDSMLLLKETLSKNNDAAVLEKAKNKIETETHLANIKLLESEKDKQILVRNGVIGFGIMAGVIGFQILRKRRLRHRKNLEILELEKRRSAEELRNAQSLLDTYVESLKQKNQLLEQFALEVEQLQSISQNNSETEKEDVLKRLQEATILTDDDWISFKKMFTKVHASFFMQLNERFPGLTQAETRLLTLSKLGLSVKEKANMLGISPDSVRRTQQRLNKKIGLSETEMFEELTH